MEIFSFFAKKKAISCLLNRRIFTLFSKISKSLLKRSCRKSLELHSIKFWLKSSYRPPRNGCFNHKNASTSFMRPLTKKSQEGKKMRPSKTNLTVQSFLKNIHKQKSYKKNKLVFFWLFWQKFSVLN